MLPIACALSSSLFLSLILFSHHWILAALPRRLLYRAGSLSRGRVRGCEGARKSYKLTLDGAAGGLGFDSAIPGVYNLKAMTMYNLQDDAHTPEVHRQATLERLSRHLGSLGSVFKRPDEGLRYVEPRLRRSKCRH